MDKVQKKKKLFEPTFVLTNTADAQALPEATKSADAASEIRHDELKTEQAAERFAQTHTLASHLKMEEAFDKIAANSCTTDLHRLIESTLQAFFSAETVLFYQDISGVKVLYCPLTTAYCPHGSGLVGFAQFSRKTIVVDRASDHSAYSLSQEGGHCPPTSHVLIFPLFDSSSHVRGVVQVIRNHAAPSLSGRPPSLHHFSRYLFIIFQRFCSYIYFTIRYHNSINDHPISLPEPCAIRTELSRTIYTQF